MVWERERDRGVGDREIERGGRDRKERGEREERGIEKKKDIYSDCE